MFADNTEASFCCNGGHGVPKSVVRSGGAADVRTTEEMDPERVKRPAGLAGRLRGCAELRQDKARAECDRGMVAGKLKRSNNWRRREPRPLPRSSHRAQRGAFGSTLKETQRTLSTARSPPVSAMTTETTSTRHTALASALTGAVVPRKLT